MRNDIYQLGQKKWISIVHDGSMMLTISGIVFEDSLEILVDIEMLWWIRAYSIEYQSLDNSLVHVDQLTNQIWLLRVLFSYTTFGQNQWKRVAHRLD